MKFCKSISFSNPSLKITIHSMSVIFLIVLCIFHSVLFGIIELFVISPPIDFVLFNISDS